MKVFVKAYRLLNILSIDVAVGAVVCALFFAKIFHISIFIFGLISLGLTVWVIYTADHLLDAYKTTSQAATERHRFHQKHFRALLVCLLIASALDAVQLIFIREIVLVEGTALAVVIVLYFLLHRQLKFFKEIVGAALYCGGVLLIPMAIKKNTLVNPQIILILQFAITALINLLLFSWFDRQKDEQDKHSSFATIMGETKTKNVLWLLFFIQAIFSGFLILRSDFISALVLILMNIFLLLIFVKRSYFEVNDRYRLLGDAVFLLPTIYLIWK